MENILPPCVVSNLLLLQVKSRLWVRSLLEIPRTDIEISSKLVARVIIIIFKKTFDTDHNNNGTSNFIKWSNCFSLTTLCSKVTKLPYGVNPAYLGHRTHLVTTQVNAPTSPPPPSAPTTTAPPPPTKLYHLTFQVLALEPPEAGSIPLWILILAILAGLLFLSILTAILYKLGFFRWFICFCVRKQVFILRKDDLIFNDLSVQEEKAGGLQLPRNNPGLSSFGINISKLQTYSG